MIPLLSVRDLSVSIASHAVIQPLSFTAFPGQIIAVTGESGSGKSTLARSIMGLLPTHFQASGDIEFEGQHLLTHSEHDYRSLRGRRISMVFQEPMTALNPIRRIGRQISDTLRLHGFCSRPNLAQQVAWLLERVGLTAAGVTAEAYPHALSGGQRQRVLLAMAIACQPSLLIADEFTTALDSFTQAEIMALVRSLADENGIAVLMISHDLGLIRRYARHVLVMHQGSLVESAETTELFEAPQHPYTRRLFAMSLHGTHHPPLTRIPVPPFTTGRVNS